MHSALARTLFDDGVVHITPELCEARSWELHTAADGIVDITFHATDRMPIRPRFRFADWNAMPPSLEWRNKKGSVLVMLPHSPGSQLNNSAHPATGRPFTCMAGILEYHRHPQHLTDVWDNYRDQPGYDLGGIITRVWRAWKATTP